MLALADLVAKTAAEEGRDIILAMLLVGLVFIGVALIGDVGSWLRHRRGR
jgi:hypothetical protein